jgi:hypothetical protein
MIIKKKNLLLIKNILNLIYFIFKLNKFWSKNIFFKKKIQNKINFDLKIFFLKTKLRN